jgi:hypothetical protein
MEFSFAVAWFADQRKAFDDERRSWLLQLARLSSEAGEAALRSMKNW